MRPSRFFLILFLWLWMAVPTLAGDLWTVHVESIYPKVSETVGGLMPGAPTLSIDGGEGFGFGLQYNQSERWVFDLSALKVDVYTDVRVPYPADEVSAGDLNLYALSFLAAFDFLPSTRVDLTLGPTLSYVRFGNVETTIEGSGESAFTARFDFDSKVAVGASCGLDVAIGNMGWQISFDIRYLNTELNDKSVDVMLYSLGCGYRF